MKIAILSCFYPFRGGISQFNSCLLEELGKMHDVKAFNFTRQYPDILFPGKTQYVTEDDNAVPVDSEAVLDTADPLSYRRTWKRIREWGPDLLIVRYWMPYFAPSLGYVTRKMRRYCKVISILDNVIPHERHFFDRLFTKYFLSGSDGCITLCDAVAKDLEDIRPDIPYKVCPHPLYSHFGEMTDREEAERKLGTGHGGRNILFFGLIREYKGLDILIRAFSMLGDSSYRLIIAGEPYGSFEPYARLIDSSPLRDNIHIFPKYIRDDEVSTYFSAADVCVLPYRSATQSGISAIACHFGVPMITTAVGGLKECIADRGTGIVVEEAEPEAVTAAIRRYFSDTSLREKMKECIALEKERLSWRRFCEDLVSFSETL